MQTIITQVRLPLSAQEYTNNFFSSQEYENNFFSTIRNLHSTIQCNGRREVFLWWNYM